MYDDPSFIYYDAAKNNKVGSVVKFLTNTSPANIYPTLKIGPGEKKSSSMCYLKEKIPANMEILQIKLH